MNTVRDLLRDADPIRQEPQPAAGERDRVRQAVVAAASEMPTASARSHRRIMLVATASILIIGIAAVTSRSWPKGAVTLQAAVRFEVRLAEDAPAAGLQEARVSGSDSVIYLHPEIVVSNGDIARSRVIQGNGPSRFGIAVEFTGPGAQRMRDATADHIGKPVAIIIDGEIVSAPVLRGPIGSSAVISGDYTQAEAERIANGMVIR